MCFQLGITVKKIILFVDVYVGVKYRGKISCAAVFVLTVLSILIVVNIYPAFGGNRRVLWGHCFN